jgi:hypothetical protein
MSDANASKESTKQLFSVMGVTRVVCVDDQYVVPELGDDQIIGLFQALTKDDQQKISAFEDVDTSKPPEVWKKKLRDAWKKLERNHKQEIETQLKDLNKEESSEIDSLAPLKDLLDFVDLKTLSPEEWNQQRETLLKEAKTTPTLFLFDKDLSNADMGDEGGITLLKQAIDCDDAICGMLSHHFPKDAEYSEWEKFVSEHKLAPNRFILISKQHLDPESWLGFARMLKLTLLNAPCRLLASLLSDRMKSGIDAANSNISAISVYDFEDIVFRKSQKEGIWEADTLFRILSLYQKKELRGKADSNEEIHSTVKKIRHIFGVDTGPHSSQQKSREIQRLEWYDEAQEVNSQLSPIALGDIFQRTGSQKKYVLLCQPCDLMVRSNGRRNYELADVFLAEISSKFNEKYSFKKLKFFDDKNESWVNFQCRVAVSLDVLDLCAFNADGKATYGKEILENSLLIPAWASRGSQLSKIYEAVLADITTPPRQSNLTKAGKMPKSSRDGKFAKGTHDPAMKIIEYSVTRVGRVCSPFAEDILGSFCSYLSRPAFGMELAEDEIFELETCDDDVQTNTTDSAQ